MDPAAAAAAWGQSQNALRQPLSSPSFLLLRGPPTLPSRLSDSGEKRDRFKNLHVDFRRVQLRLWKSKAVLLKCRSAFRFDTIGSSFRCFCRYGADSSHLPLGVGI